MKNTFLKRVALVLLVGVSFSSCENSDPITVDIETQDFVWKGLNAYYLYQDQVESLSDSRFSSDIQLVNYLTNFSSPEDIFNSLTIAGDNRSSLVSNFNLINTATPFRNSFTTGLEFGVMKDQTRIDSIVGYVLDVLPYSYASTKNIARGEFFYAVVDENNNIIRLAEDNYIDNLIEYQQSTLSLLMADFDGTTLTPNGKRVDLIKEQYQHPAIHLKNVIDLAPTKVGYLMYQNDFSRNYIQDLNATMLEFRNEPIDELILDLRYNIGGGSFANIVAEISSMITGQFANEVLIKETWNTKAQEWFQLNQPDSIVTRFPTTLENGTTINSLNLTDIYIVLNGNDYRGNAALELLINSLDAYMNVHVIGNSTIGNNIGAITLYDSPDYDFFAMNVNHTYALQPAVLTFSNLNDQTYQNGLSPVMQLCPTENPLELGELGEATDPILNRILNYITTGTIAAPPACNSLGLEILYNSIHDQIIEDNGIFIKQDLPNLGR